MTEGAEVRASANLCSQLEAYALSGQQQTATHSELLATSPLQAATLPCRVSNCPAHAPFPTCFSSICLTSCCSASTASPAGASLAAMLSSRSSTRGRSWLSQARRCRAGRSVGSAAAAAAAVSAVALLASCTAGCGWVRALGAWEAAGPHSCEGRLQHRAQGLASPLLHATALPLPYNPLPTQHSNSKSAPAVLPTHQHWLPPVPQSSSGCRPAGPSSQQA